MVNNQIKNLKLILNSTLQSKYKNLILLILICFLSFSILFCNKALATIEDHSQDNNQSNEQFNNSVNSELLKLLNDIKFMHAEFNQEIFNKYGELQQEQSGIIKLKKPNLLNWHVLKPDHLLIVIDGKYIWNYDIDLEQITVKKFETNNANYKIINLLLGNVTQNLNDFKITLLNDCKVDRCFRLINNKKKFSNKLTKNNTDKNSENAYQKNDDQENINIDKNFIYFDLGFNKQRLVLLRLYDQLEQQTVFKFYKFKPMPNQDAFKFKIPKGVDLIKEVD